MKMFLPPKSLFLIICHPFQIMSNINRCTISIQDILKRKATWDEPIKRLNLKGQIQSEIGFSYLGHLVVGLI